MSAPEARTVYTPPDEVVDPAAATAPMSALVNDVGVGGGGGGGGEGGGGGDGGGGAAAPPMARLENLAVASEPSRWLVTARPAYTDAPIEIVTLLRWVQLVPSAEVNAVNTLPARRKRTK